MPSTWITTGAWTRNSEDRLIETVQVVVLSSLKIPDYDIVLDVHAAATRIVPIS
jgi:hypothetical protein